MRWIVVSIWVMLASVAVAQVGQAPVFVQPPPVSGTCSNALDFTKACNSQYIPVVL